jgi:hypothetical protein
MTDEKDLPFYTPQDLAYHPVHQHQAEEGSELRALLEWHAENRGGPVVVAELIVLSCAVGYGGHYYEVTDDIQEGNVLLDLTRLLSPYYQLPKEQTYTMLEQVRTEWIQRIHASMDAALEQWRREGYVVDFRPVVIDHCPTCGKYVKDSDLEGCEAPDGQRWCVDHALEMLARLRRATLTARGELG